MLLVGDEIRTATRYVPDQPKTHESVLVVPRVKARRCVFMVVGVSATFV